MLLRRAHDSVTDFAAEITPRVIFGAHACDINAVNRLDLVFKDGRYPDPYYVRPGNATLIVGISCMPSETCFCHLWGSDEARFGYDLFLQDIGGKYLVSISSVEAANILEAACNPRVPPTRTVSSSATPRVGARRRSTTLFPTSRTWPCSWTRSIRTRSGRSWADAACRARRARRCAPRCFCFDIQDTFDPSGERAARARVGRVHCAAVRAGGRRPQLPRRRAQPRAASHVPQGSTGSSRTMTACCAWGAVAA